MLCVSAHCMVTYLLEADSVRACVSTAFARLCFSRDSLWPQVLPQRVDKRKTASAEFVMAGMHTYECFTVCLHGKVHDAFLLIAVGPDGKSVRLKHDPSHAMLQSLRQALYGQRKGQPQILWQQPCRMANSRDSPSSPSMTPCRPSNAKDPTGSSPGPRDPQVFLAQRARHRVSIPSQAFKTQLDPFEALFADPGLSLDTSALDP